VVGVCNLYSIRDRIVAVTCVCYAVYALILGMSRTGKTTTIGRLWESVTCVRLCLRYVMMCADIRNAENGQDDGYWSGVAVIIDFFYAQCRSLLLATPQ
jgi:hypothetical protein